MLVYVCIVCICKYLYVLYVFERVYVYVSIVCICKYMYVYVSICMYIFRCTYCTYMFVYVCISQRHKYRYMQIRAYTYNTYTYVHTYRICTKQSGWLINQLGDPQFYNVQMNVLDSIFGRICHPFLKYEQNTYTYVQNGSLMQRRR